MIPTPPTDNLYKFVTFLGIAVMLFCFWTISETLKSTSSGINSFSYASERLASEQDDLQKYAAALVSETNDLENRVSEAKRSGNNDPHLEDKFKKEADYLIEKSAVVRERLKVISESSLKVQEKMDIARDLADTSFDVLWVYSAGILFGLVCFFWGVASWYSQHQKYQDMILQHTALSLGSRPDVHRNERMPTRRSNKLLNKAPKRPKK